MRLFKISEVEITRNDCIIKGQKTEDASDYTIIYFIVSGEISLYLVKIKEVSITSEMISYHFTSDSYDLYFHSSL